MVARPFAGSKCPVSLSIMCCKFVIIFSISSTAHSPKCTCLFFVSSRNTPKGCYPPIKSPEYQLASLSSSDVLMNTLMRILHTLDLKHSPYILIQGIRERASSLLMLWLPLYTDSPSNITALTKHPLPYEQSFEAMAPLILTRIALATRLQMSVSVGLHGNRPP